MPSSSLNINHSSNFIFAYQINPEAINKEALPKPTDQEIYQQITMASSEKEP